MNRLIQLVIVAFLFPQMSFAQDQDPQSSVLSLPRCGQYTEYRDQKNCFSLQDTFLLIDDSAPSVVSERISVATVLMQGRANCHKFRDHMARYSCFEDVLDPHHNLPKTMCQEAESHTKAACYEVVFDFFATHPLLGSSANIHERILHETAMIQSVCDTVLGDIPLRRDPLFGDGDSYTVHGSRRYECFSAALRHSTIDAIATIWAGQEREGDFGWKYRDGTCHAKLASVSKYMLPEPSCFLGALGELQLATQIELLSADHEEVPPAYSIRAASVGAPGRGPNPEEPRQRANPAGATIPGKLFLPRTW